MVERAGDFANAVVHVATLDGDKIKAWYAYYPRRSIARIKQACDMKPDVLAPTSPCAETFVRLRAYLDELIAKGLVQED